MITEPQAAVATAIVPEAPATGVPPTEQPSAPRWKGFLGAGKNKASTVPLSRSQHQAPTDVETQPVTRPSPFSRIGKVLHVALTLLLVAACVGQFIIFSQQIMQLEADQNALMRRVPAGIEQRLDTLEALTVSLKTQGDLISALREQVDTVLSQDPQQAVDTLRASVRAGLEQLSTALKEQIDQQQKHWDTLTAEHAQLEESMRQLKAAQQKPDAGAASATSSPPKSATKPVAAVRPASKSAKLPTPPFELRGIEYRGGVPYAVTTTPGDMTFTSLQLLMEGQSREGWRLLRTMDNSAIVRSPAGKELTLAIR